MDQEPPNRPNEGAEAATSDEGDPLQDCWDMPLDPADILDIPMTSVLPSDLLTPNASGESMFRTPVGGSGQPGGGDIWGVESLTIPSMGRVDWGQPSQPWGRGGDAPTSLQLPGLAALQDPLMSIQAQTQDGRTPFSRMGGMGTEVNGLSGQPGGGNNQMQEELVRVKRERDELERKLKEMEQARLENEQQSSTPVTLSSKGTGETVLHSNELNGLKTEKFANPKKEKVVVEDDGFQEAKPKRGSKASAEKKALKADPPPATSSQTNGDTPKSLHGSPDTAAQLKAEINGGATKKAAGEKGVTSAAALADEWGSLAPSNSWSQREKKAVVFSTGADDTAAEEKPLAVKEEPVKSLSPSRSKNQSAKDAASQNGSKDRKVSEPPIGKLPTVTAVEVESKGKAEETKRREKERQDRESKEREGQEKETKTQEARDKQNPHAQKSKGEKKQSIGKTELKPVAKTVVKEKAGSKSSEPATKSRKKQRGEEDEGDAVERISIVRRLWDGLCQLEQDLGSCIFTLVYFWVYFILHGLTPRLLTIAWIVLLQFSFQIQYPKFLWEPVNKLVEAARDLWGGDGRGRGRKAATSSKNRRQQFMRGGMWILILSAVAFFMSTLYDVYQIERAGRAIMMRINPNSPNQRVHPAKVSEADRLCDEAQAAEAQRAWADVQAKLQKALKIDPNNVCSLYNYGRLLDYVWNNPEKAEQMYIRALGANPRHVPSLRNYGYFLYYVRKDYSGAASAWEKALQEQPNELDVLCGYASLHYHVHGRLSKAEQLFAKALKVQPNHANTLHNYGKLLHYAKGNFTRAEKLYKRVLENFPNHVSVLMDYASLLQDFPEKLGMNSSAATEKAAEFWERVLVLNPNHFDALFSLARVEQFNRNRPQKAERLYKRVLAEGPMHIPALSNYGWLLQQMGKIDAAQEQYEKLVHLGQDARYVEALVSYGHLLGTHRKQHAKAQQMYMRALLVQPTRTITPAVLPGHKCWLCCNSSKVQDLCCEVLQETSRPEPEEQVWWLRGFSK